MLVTLELEVFFSETETDAGLETCPASLCAYYPPYLP